MSPKNKLIVLSLVPRSWKIWEMKQSFPVPSHYTGTRFQKLIIPREYSVHTANDLAEIKTLYIQNMLFYFISFFMGWDWVHFVLRFLFGLLYQPQMIDDDDCGTIGGMQIGKGSRSSRRKPAPVSLCPPQIPHDLTRAWTRAAAVGSRQQNAWAMTRPSQLC
jgi:hypothetical protein